MTLDSIYHTCSTEKSVALSLKLFWPAKQCHFSFPWHRCAKDIAGEKHKMSWFGYSCSLEENLLTCISTSSLLQSGLSRDRKGPRGHFTLSANLPGQHRTVAVIPAVPIHPETAEVFGKPLTFHGVVSSNKKTGGPVALCWAAEWPPVLWREISCKP